MKKHLFRLLSGQSVFAEPLFRFAMLLLVLGSSENEIENELAQFLVTAIGLLYFIGTIMVIIDEEDLIYEGLRRLRKFCYKGRLISGVLFFVIIDLLIDPAFWIVLMIAMWHWHLFVSGLIFGVIAIAEGWVNFQLYRLVRHYGHQVLQKMLDEQFK